MDNDKDNTPVNCALTRTGGWWFNRCHLSNPTGTYLRGGLNDVIGLNWYTAGEKRGKLNYSFKTFSVSIKVI